jgi:hypothetical protein
MAEAQHAEISEKIAYLIKKRVDLRNSLAEEQAKRAEVERNLEASNQQIQQLQEEKKTLAKNLDESREKISVLEETLVEFEALKKEKEALDLLNLSSPKI